MSISISGSELMLWAQYIKETCGISLDQSKAYLLQTRLDRLLTETHSHGFSELLYKLRADTTDELRSKIVDAITTNETSFFRDSSPFDLLRYKLIPELIDRRQKRGVGPIAIRIWSAACSTGQEVYSIAIVLKEMLGDLSGYDVRIVGSDISSRVVAKASKGIYSQLEIERGLPAAYVAKYFRTQAEGYQIRDEVRAMACFRRMNLLERYTFPAPFDIVLCRNVAIYFSEADKRKLFANVRRCMAHDGALIIGSTESLNGLCPEYEPRRYLRAVYYKLGSS